MYTQKYVFLVVCLSFSAVLAGCASTAPRSEYFGYNNSPRSADEQQELAKESSRSNSSYDILQTDGGVYSPEYYRNAYGYIPVIVPWWDGYYDWPGFSRISVRVFYGYSGYHYAPYYPWYSPWYDYNPFYGRAFHYHDHQFWQRPWYCDWQPITHTSTPQRVGTRNFGTQRGTTTVENANNGRTDNGTITVGSRVRGSKTVKMVNPPSEIEVMDKSNSGTITTDNGRGNVTTEKKGNAPDESKVMEYNKVPILTQPASESKRVTPTNTTRSNARSREVVTTPPVRSTDKPQNVQSEPTNSRRRNP